MFKFQTELQKLREENKALREKLARSNEREVKQWENLLTYNGSPQLNNLEEQK